MPPVCGRVFDDPAGTIYECTAEGDHFCEPRALHVVAFFDEILVHTKGHWARQRFTLSTWQEYEIIRPLFGWVRWSEEHQLYVRRYTIAWIELGRKNGKSEIGAGIALYLLEGDGEEGAEVYGAAKDVGQARKVWDVAHRMMTLSPLLRSRLEVNRRDNRILNRETGSYYETVTRDALGELGHNPHGVIFDEIISQPDGSLWDTLRTAMGARTQPLMVALTTAGNDPSGFAGVTHDEMERIAEDPARAEHIFVFMRNTPMAADPWDEANWYDANPALGEFLSIDSLRQEAEEAKKNPRSENSFRQFRLNQWVRQVTRWMPLHDWDACIGELAPNPEWLTPKLTGRRCYGGLDLSARLDLTALTWWFPATDDQPAVAMWRFWIPEAAVAQLDKATGGLASAWVEKRWIVATPGDVIDYEAVYTAIVEDHQRFAVAGFAYDEWSGEPVRQEIQTRTGLEMHPVRGNFQRMTPLMKELERLVRAGSFQHGGNPVARFCIDSLEVRRSREDPDQLRPQRPDRQQTGKRIDGAVSLLLALEASLTDSAEAEPEYAFISL